MEENKKYELVEDDFIIHKGKKLYRIRALKGISSVICYIPEGFKGGYVEGYHNLSQEDNCWIFNDSKVYGNAVVSKCSAIIYNSEVYGNARVIDSVVKYDSEVYGNAIVKNNSEINNYSKVFGNAVIVNSSIIKNTYISYNSSVISKGGIILNDSSMSGNSTVTISAGAGAEFRRLIATNNSKMEILREENTVIPDRSVVIHNLTREKNEIYRLIKEV